MELCRAPEDALDAPAWVAELGVFDELDALGALGFEVPSALGGTKNDSSKVSGLRAAAAMLDVAAEDAVAAACGPVAPPEVAPEVTPSTRLFRPTSPLKISSCCVIASR